MENIEVQERTPQDESDKEAIKELRNTEAQNLRELRQHRDSMREVESEAHAESKNVTGTILKYASPQHYRARSEKLKLRMDSARKRGDTSQSSAVALRDDLQFLKTEDGTSEMTAFQKSVLDPLEQISSIEDAKEHMDVEKALDNLPLSAIREALSLDREKKYSSRYFAHETLSQLKLIQENFQTKTIPSIPAKQKFASMIETLLAEEAGKEDSLFVREPDIILPLLQSVDLGIQPRNRLLFMETIDACVSEEYVRKLCDTGNLSDQRTLDTLFFFRSKTAKKVVLEIIDEYLNSDLTDQDKLVAFMGACHRNPNMHNGDVEGVIHEKVGAYIEKRFGLTHGSEVARRWQRRDDLNIQVNLVALERLEKEAGAGAAELLHKEYGIHEFVRYPVEMLAEQVKLHGKDVPYGTMFFPESDYNDAFDQSEGILEQLYKGTHGKSLTRIFEIGSRIQFAKFLLGLQKEYDHKMSYMIFGAHGDKSSVSFGYLMGEFDTHMLHESASLEKIKNMFVPEPSILLFSCKTGAEGGFAELLSKKLGANIQAPTISTSVKSLSVKYEGRKPIFDLTFNKSDDARATYVKGVKQT
jgi:hypothetical protein